MDARSDLLIDARPLLPPERTELLRLLAGLDDRQWTAPTECPGWTVAGIACHILGDDLSLLARQRDAAVPGLFLQDSLPSWPGAPDAPLDRFNQRWVQASSFLSPPLIGDLLAASGEQTQAFYEQVDPFGPGEPVLLFGSAEPAPWWQVIAREHLERWAHHAQIRRAVGAGAGMLAELDTLGAVTTTFTAALAPMLGSVAAEPGAEVVLDLGPAATLVRSDQATWRCEARDARSPVARISVAQEHAVALLSRGLTGDEAKGALHVNGEPTLGASVSDLVAAAVARPGAAP